MSYNAREKALTVNRRPSTANRYTDAQKEVVWNYWREINGNTTEKELSALFGMSHVVIGIIISKGLKSLKTKQHD